MLLFVAAVVGIVISRGREPSEVPAADEAAVQAAAIVHTEPAQQLITCPAPQPQQQAAPVADAAPAAEDEAPEPAPKNEPPAEAKPLLLSAVTLLPVKAPATPSSAPEAGPPPSLDALVQAQSLLKAGKRVEARRLLTPLYLEARGQRAAQFRTVLDAISRELVFNPRCLEGATVHVVAAGETLTRIGKQYGVNWRMIARLNGMQPDGMLRLGQKLKVLEGEPSMVIRRDEFRLVLLWNGAYVKEYPIGIGKEETPTPTGQFVVDTLLVKPRWYRPGGGVVEYGEESNPLGERWIGFADEPGASGIGIHGTNDEASIGTRCSNGCVRLRNADVVELYDFVREGTRVVITE